MLDTGLLLLFKTDCSIFSVLNCYPKISIQIRISNFFNFLKYLFQVNDSENIEPMGKHNKGNRNGNLLNS